MKILIRQVVENAFQLRFHSIHLVKNVKEIPVASVGSQGDQHCVHTITLFTLLVRSDIQSFPSPFYSYCNIHLVGTPS